MHFAEEHTASYYAATVNHVTSYPRLREHVRADVCVVGGGFSGVAATLTLAERGYHVVLLEANRIGWGASGRNGGQLIGGIGGEEVICRKDPSRERLMWEMRWRGHEIIRERVARYGIACDLKNGYVDVAIKPRHMAQFEADAERLARHEYPFEYRLLSRADTAEMLGTDAYIGGLLNMGNGHLHPLNLCIGEARAAESLGASIYEQTAALKLDHGDSVRVSSAEGSVTANCVVLCGNAYQHLDNSLRARFLPVRSYISATTPLDDSLLDVINPHDLAVCDPNFVLQYFRLSADKRLLFGARLNYFGDDPEFIASQHRPRIAKIYPALRDIGIDFAWGGTIAVTLSRVPQMGRIAPNVFYAHAYSGHGVNVTHLAGEIMGDAIAGTMERFDVFAALKAYRIPGAVRFGSTLASLGVFYYGLKDKL